MNVENTITIQLSFAEAEKLLDVMDGAEGADDTVYDEFYNLLNKAVLGDDLADEV